MASSATARRHRELIIALAARHKLPAVYYRRYFVTGGGLASYGYDLAGQFRSAAGYVDRILKGEKPANLPVQAPTRYELAINLKTAKTLRPYGAAYVARPRRRGDRVKRREFITLVGGATAMWPLAARAQQPAFQRGRLPQLTISRRSFNRCCSSGPDSDWLRRGQKSCDRIPLWAGGQYERLPSLLADLIGHQVAVIVASGGPAAARPKRLQRRFQSCLLSAWTPSRKASWPISTDRAVMQRV